MTCFKLVLNNFKHVICPEVTLCSWGDVGIQKLTPEMWSYLVLVVVHPLWRWSFNRGSTVNCINPTKGYCHAMFKTSYPDRLWQKANNNVSAMEGELNNTYSHGTLCVSQKLNRLDSNNKTYFWSLHLQQICCLLQWNHIRIHSKNFFLLKHVRGCFKV